MPTCGAQYFRYIHSSWQRLYADALSPKEKELITEALEVSAKSLGLWEAESWGDKIEDRVTQVTFSALGQEAPIAAKRRWDPTGSKRKLLCRLASIRLPEFEFRIGGSSSVDVTRKGVDKAYGVFRLTQHLALPLEQVLFIGDKLEEGGNDYPVKAMGVRCISVTRWQDTLAVLKRMLWWLDSGVRDSWTFFKPEI